MLKYLIMPRSIMTHKTGRHERMYVKDNPHLKVHKMDCVPSNRSKGSWTNGVKAWDRIEGSGTDSCIGWFFPPRTRNKNHHRWSPSVGRMVPRKAREVGKVHQEEE